MHYLPFSSRCVADLTKLASSEQQHDQLAKITGLDLIDEWRLYNSKFGLKIQNIFNEGSLENRVLCLNSDQSESRLAESAKFITKQLGSL